MHLELARGKGDVNVAIEAGRQGKRNGVEGQRIKAFSGTFLAIPSGPDTLPLTPFLAMCTIPRGKHGA